MSVIVSSALGIAISLVGLILLAASDTKRHRRGEVKFPLHHYLRFIVILATVAPMFVLFTTGNYSALLVWMGVTTVLGWGVALVPSERI